MNDINQYFLELIKNDNTVALEKFCIDNHHWRELINFKLLFPELLKYNNGNSLNVIGIMHYHGYYVEKDSQKTFEYLKNSADKNNLFGLCNLGIIYKNEKNYQKAFEYFQQSAEKNNSFALNYLGQMYYYGYYIKQNYDKALECFKKSAEKNNPEGLHNLGAMYFNNDYVEKDVEKDVAKDDQKVFEYFYFSLLENNYDSKRIIQKYYLEKLWKKIQEKEDKIRYLEEKNKSLEEKLSFYMETLFKQ